MAGLSISVADPSFGVGRRAMPDSQNTGAVRGPGTVDQETAGSGAGDEEVESLGADGARRDEWRETEGEDTETQRADREAAAEEHQERFSKGLIRGPI
jgi:hypothetical protein